MLSNFMVSGVTLLSVGVLKLETYCATNFFKGIPDAGQQMKKLGGDKATVWIVITAFQHKWDKSSHRITHSWGNIFIPFY